MEPLAASSCGETSSSPLAVRPSAIPSAGRGLFTTAPIPAGSVVCVYTGAVLPTAAAVALKDKAYLMRLGPQVYIDAADEEEHAGVMARYING